MENFTYSWKNLTVWVTERTDSFWIQTKSKNIILNNVNGCLKSNSLVAIMGLSGVGKTSFLATLAGKNKEKDGFILFNNNIIKDEDVRHISSYVYQEDIVVDSLNVLEHMNFMSGLKLNNNIDKKRQINDILHQLNLDGCKNTYLKYLSGGERKKLSLGVELLNDRRILLCDEPTTGLDSYSAITVIQNLESVAKGGKLVVVAIHQPSSELFHYFTHIIILSPGKIFYQGSSEDIVHHFQSLNMTCPMNYNPADYYISCVTKLSQEVDGNSFDFTYLDDCSFVDLNVIKSKDKCFCTQLLWLTWRVVIDTKRNFGYHLFQYSLLLITATLLASFYSSLNTNGNKVQNVKGILFLITSELIFTHTYAVINTFGHEYSIFLREKSLYSTHCYFISKIVTTIPRNIIQPFSFLVINFIFVDIFTDFINFAQIFGVLCIACVSATTLGLCISAVFTSVQYMDLFMAPFELITMLAAGILLNLRSLNYFNWIKYSSPFYYTYESLSILHWSKVNTTSCSNDSICYRNGKEVLDELGFHNEDVYVLWNILKMLLLTCVVGFMGFCALLHKRKKCTSF